MKHFQRRIVFIIKQKKLRGRAAAAGADFQEL